MDDALSIYNQAHDISLSIGDYADAASALTNIAGITFNIGDKGKAIDMLYESLGYLVKQPFPDTERSTRITLVQALEFEGRSTEEIFAVAGQIVKFTGQLQSMERDVLRSSLLATVNRYVKDHPDSNTSAVKTKFLPGLI
jgi:hypothetical protein